MKTRDLKVARIGNSKGIRLPAESLKRYRIVSAVVMEERAEGILLRPAGPSVEKLSWEDTAREMAAAEEDWSEWEAAGGDGLESVSWNFEVPRQVTEKKAKYTDKSRSAETIAKRYSIYWAALNPSRGSELAKSRPVVIVSLDILNDQLETVTVCPLTTQLHPAWRSRLPVVCDRRPAEVAVDQIRAISKSRLGSKISALSEDEAAALRRLITEMYGE